MLCRWRNLHGEYWHGYEHEECAPLRATASRGATRGGNAGNFAKAGVAGIRQQADDSNEVGD